MATPTLEWRGAARRDLLSIVDFISDDNPDAALKLLDDIESKAEQLLQHPRLYKAGRVVGTREMLVRRNYVVIYEENDECVTILRVLHSAQLWPN